MAFTYATKGSRKAAARALKMPLATLRTHLERLYAANRVGSALDLQTTGQQRLLAHLARRHPEIAPVLEELASTLEPFSGTGG